MRHISDDVAVMYLGKIVEMASSARSLQHAAASVHAGVALGRARSRVRTASALRKRIVLEGDVPSPIDPPSGCRFRTRCWKAQELCATEEPRSSTAAPGHPVACHFAEIAAEIV